MNSQSSKSRVKIILKKNKTINKIWHPESTLVFKSYNEKLVIGRFQDGKVIPLDDEALDRCVQWKFKYDTSLVDEEEVTDSDEGDDGEPEPVNKETPKPEQVSEEDESTPEPVKKETHKHESENEEDEPDTTPELEPIKVSKKAVAADLAGDVNLQLGLVFTNLDSEVSLLRKNIDRILGNVQNKASTELATLSKELSVTKTELSTTKDALATMTKDFEDTKAKLAKIRNAIGF